MNDTLKTEEQDTMDTFSLQIKQKAIKIGFLDCAISPAEELSVEKEHLKLWLDAGMHGEMRYMRNHFEKRTDPRLLVENARSVISVLLNYYPNEKQKNPKAPFIAKYAYGEDYHKVLKDKLFELLNYIQSKNTTVTGRAFVDSAPVLEKAWARRAGLGWIGKNSCLISRAYGSFFFIGELIVDIELEYDQPLKRDYCGECTKCMDACPTQAIVSPKTVDSRKCISYQTIENRGEIDPSLKGLFRNRLFGCDICQDVCPWNTKAAGHHIREFNSKAELLAMGKEDWNLLDEESFRVKFKNSALLRTGFRGIMRNLNFLD
ncbi:MAG: tRNA epoxyqueuosine(34) reductase QueG [Bacteroidota bacterium]|nr:tRNA epoxyqueuosine(34) reductase QueG [Bacteroidota bacterium]